MTCPNLQGGSFPRLDALNVLNVFYLTESFSGMPKTCVLFYSLNPFRIRSVASLSVIGLAQGEKWTVERVIGHSGEKIWKRNGEKWRVERVIGHSGEKILEIR